MWLYKKTGRYGRNNPQFEIGFYDEQGNWIPEPARYPGANQMFCRREAERRVHYLNSGETPQTPIPFTPEKEGA